jgi:hypothetical protein
MYHTTAPQHPRRPPNHYKPFYIEMRSVALMIARKLIKEIENRDAPYNVD